ncbi:aminodeoxychorismate synthase component I [Oricola sp.]|uniref:aminodeoxychorismate synthase component I n=1 Tax=Oricola sp. TaxID=1979950 RepID=UPI0025E915E4|nr:aminodeoxychorismate synthase component I [Oricola sp.]MCI5074681.1 aminodeoxychorismate synthase component I [Oricola sp.]
MGRRAAPSVLFRNDLEATSVFFSGPREIVIARDGAELAAAFDRIERARGEGLWSAGFVSYEAGFFFDEALASRGGARAMRTPLLCFGLFDGPEVDAALPDGGNDGELLSGLRADWDGETYAGKFAVLHDHLRAGNCYQGNLTFPIRGAWRGNPRDVFDGLTARQPVRYGACVDLCDPVLVSRSPELFFQVGRDGWIEAHPMKGTAPRRPDPAEDAAEILKMKDDIKSQAENRMIVDLLRNDISRISEVGSLHVPALFEVETYPTLHQMISRVRAKLRTDVTIYDIFAALFPCGSITGAPKIAAMEILDDLETSPREAYCGAIGYVAPGGEMRFSVAIRTLSLFDSGEAVFNVGGGIVFDSVAEAEYEEALLKARFAAGEKWISG